MSDTEPADSYLVGGAGLPVTEATDSFQYNRARDFQAEGSRWVSAGDHPAAVLAAPTGGGKTAVIARLARESDRTLCLYPTNALATAQQDTLEKEFDLDVDVLTGRTLSGSGHERTQQVMQFATDPAGGDVVLTNPDVLQAILQHRYFSPGSEIMRFFANFDAAVYDEFHYYGPLGASGLLMQMKVLTERGEYRTPEGRREFPRILLPSATPSTAFVDHLQEDLDLSAQWIRSQLVPLDVGDPGPIPDAGLVYDQAEEPAGDPHDPETVEPPNDAHDIASAREITVIPPNDIDRFRYPMLVNRWGEHVEDSFDRIAHLLKMGAGLVDSSQPTGKVAVIFNSAAQSNRFHQYLLADDDLAPFSIKDNGYDTSSERESSQKWSILNTTSKGEVGLDFDLERLVMISPFTATAFVQRIGRAARHSPAIVDVFGLNDPLWPSIQSYPRFLARIIDSIGDPEVSRIRLRDILALRAAKALYDREQDDDYHPSDIYEDFSDFPGQSRWHRFIREVDSADENKGDQNNLFAPQMDRPTSKLVTAAKDALIGLESLRGRSISQPIRYPFGTNRDETEYDLITALRHYNINRIEDGVIVLDEGGEPGRRSGTYPGRLSEGQGIDLSHSGYQIDRSLRSKFDTQIDAATWRHTDLDSGTVRRFFEVLDLNAALLPRKVETDEFVFHCSPKGNIDEIEVIEDDT